MTGPGSDPATRPVGPTEADSAWTGRAWHEEEFDLIHVPWPPADADDQDEASQVPGSLADDDLSAVADATFHRRRLVRGGSVVFAGTIIQKATSLGLIAVLARELRVEAFAVYLFAFSYGRIFETLSDFGLDHITTRELNVRPPEQRGLVVGSSILGKAAALGLTTLVGVALAFLYDGDLRAGALVACLGILAGIPGTLGIALKARIDNTRPVVITTTSTIAGAACVAVAARAGVGAVALVAIQVGFRVASSAIALPLMRRRLAYELSYDWSETRRLLRASAPLAFSTIAAVLFFRLDQLLLAALSDLSDVGSYGAAVRLVDGINVVPIAIAAVYLPTLSHLRGRDDARFDRLAARGVRYLAATIFPLAVLATVLGGPILRFVLGDAFAGGGAVLAVLLWAHFFGAVWLLGRPALVAHERTGYLAVLSVVTAVVNVALNLALIPEHGALGAAWASLISYSVPFAMALFFSAIRRPFVAPLRAAVRPLLASTVIFGALVAVRSGGLVVGAILFAIVTPLVLAVSRSLTVSEVKQVAVSFRRRR